MSWAEKGMVVIFPPGSIFKVGAIGLITKVADLKSGLKVTVLTSTHGMIAENVTKPLREKPEGWIIVSGTDAYCYLKDV